MKEQEEGLEKEAEIHRLKAQRDHLVEKLQQLQQQVHRHSLYEDFLEEVVKMTKVLQVAKSFFSSNTNPSTGGMRKCVCMCVCVSSLKTRSRS